MEEEKASNNLADNQDCRGIVEKHYQNNILAIHIKVQILGFQKTRDVLKWIALFSRRFYLDFIDDKKGEEVMNKNMTTCPHCGKVVKKGNFCNKCGKKLAKICDCWLMKRPYNCNFQQCPDMAAFTLLLLHIQQDQKRRKYYSQYLSLLQLSFNFNKTEARHDNNDSFTGND